MKLVSTEAVMTALCQHCDSHIEMCEECGMREIIESVPSAWIKCSERLPEKSVNAPSCLTPIVNGSALISFLESPTRPFSLVT